MIRLFFTVLFGVFAATASAQSNTPDEDKGFITRFLQDNLSDAGRDVVIDGFAGALSSKATLKLLTIADDEGIWFELEDVVLNWNRVALLKGRLEVNELSAAGIRLLRIPKSTETGPVPEAAGFEFALPDLPVSIDIAKLSVARITLAPGVFGQPIAATLNGSIAIEGGAGNVDLALERSDDKTGTITIAGQFSNETGILKLDLSLSEAGDGLLASAIGLPGNPSIDFQLAGNDPVSDFTAKINLATQGHPRFSGDVRVFENPESDAPDTVHFTANLSGDISPLFQPAYQPFFGTRTSLSLNGARHTDGRLELAGFKLSSAELDLGGSLIISADGLPEQFEISGNLGSDSGLAALLPLPGDPVTIGQAKLHGSFQAGQSDRWSFDASFSELGKGALKVRAGKLTATGEINRSNDPDPKRHVSADIRASLDGLEADEPALKSAIGDRAIATLVVDWTEGEPLQVSAFDITAGDTGLSGNASFSGFDQNMRVTGKGKIIAADLSRYAGITGQTIAGGADLAATGWAEPLGGAFEIAFSGHSTDLAIGPDPVPSLLKGAGTLDIVVARDLEGVRLDRFSVTTPMASAHANGTLQTQGSDLTFDASISDVAPFVTGLSGPAKLTGTLKQDGRPWTVDITARGPANSKLVVAGGFDTTPSKADLKIDGRFPLGLANSFLPANISVNGTGTIALKMKGPLAASSLSGKISTQGASIAMPTFNASLADISASASLSGNSADIKTNASITRGGRISANGKIGLTAPYQSDLAITLKNATYVAPPMLKTRMNGALKLSGPILQGPVLSGDINLLKTEIRLVQLGGGGAIPDIIHQGDAPGVRLTRNRAGFVKEPAETTGGGKGIGLDVTLHAPGQIFVRGSGLDSEMRGDLQLTGSTTEILPVGQFNLVRGRFDFLGQRLDLLEGLLFMQGSFDPYFRVVAQSRTKEVTARVIVEGSPSQPDISFNSDPHLPDDEILAHLLFGKGISSMSPLQAAELAGQLSRLGGKGDGFFGQLRSGLALDDFDVTTSEDGNVAVRAGKYLSDNLYADIIVDSDGKSTIDLNLDVSPTVTLRGIADSHGDTGLGVFFEKDY